MTDYYKTKHSELRQFIEGYYFIKTDENTKPLNYYTFPNNFFIVSLNLGAEFDISETRFLIRNSPYPTFSSNFVSRYIKPIEIIFEGMINELTIYFKPLGIHHFVSNSDAYLKQKSSLNFNPFDDFHPVMKTILQMKDRTLQCEALEHYWLSKLLKPEMSTIEQVLKDVEADLKIDDIATKYNFSRQYLTKIFTRALGKSPSEYRKIHRFRKAIFKQKALKSLTELSYETMFYDQSHLIKDFKELTNVKPNTFFKEVDTQKDCIWLFI